MIIDNKGTFKKKMKNKNWSTSIFKHVNKNDVWKKKKIKNFSVAFFYRGAINVYK